MSAKPKPILIIEEDEDEQIINSSLLTIKPRVLKYIANNIVDELKVKVNQLKMTELTKQQKKLNTEYKDELYWKGLSEHLDSTKEREIQDEYLQFIPKLINGTTGKPTEFRIVELQQLIWHLNITTTSDYENEHSHLVTPIDLISRVESIKSRKVIRLISYVQNFYYYNNASK